MHEISLINSVVQTLEEQFSQEELERLVRINMEIGVFSNVEPLLMQNAFNAVKEATGKFQNVELSILSLPIKIHCSDCNSDTIVEKYKFICSNCGKPNNNLVQGTEMLIKSVSFDDEVG